MNEQKSEAPRALCGILSRGGAEELSPEQALREAAQSPGAWFVPKGMYTLGAPIELASDVSLTFDEGAVLCAAKDFSGDALFFAEDFQRIRLCGGRFEGMGKAAVLLSFRRGTGLSLESLVLVRSGKAAVVMQGVSRFLMRKITLLPAAASRAGIVLGGGSESGILREIRQEGVRSGGAMVVLCAKSAPIRKIRISDLFSADCRRFVHILSDNEAVADVRIRRVSGGCADGALVAEEFPKKDMLFRAEKAAVIEDVSAKFFELFSTEPSDGRERNALIHIKTPIMAFSLKALRRPGLLDAFPRVETLFIEGQSRAPIRIAGITPRQITDLLARSRLLIRGFSSSGFETEMKAGERLLLPSGGAGLITAKHKLKNQTE